MNITTCFKLIPSGNLSSESTNILVLSNSLMPIISLILTYTLSSI